MPTIVLESFLSAGEHANWTGVKGSFPSIRISLFSVASLQGLDGFQSMSQLKEGQGITAPGTFRDADLSNMPSLTWLSGSSSGFPAMDSSQGLCSSLRGLVLFLLDPKPQFTEFLPTVAYFYFI